MLFNSWTYIFFFIIAAVILRIRYIPWKASLVILSIIFYIFWDYRFLPLILLVTVVNFFAAKIIEKSKSDHTKKISLTASIALNISFLVFFKYILLIISGIELIFDFEYSGKMIHSIILPLGISFYTFQAISYVVDVFRQEKKAENSYLEFVLFIMFFPQLVAGPIMRANQLLPQLKNRPEVNSEDLRIGLNYFINGLFLKVVLADNISPFVDAAFEVNPSLLGFLDVSTMSFMFGWQIYFDFFGYSLIALGSARILGIKLVDNFRDPYISQSVREFWTRWHISLSQWIRDYLYIPLVKSFFGDERPSNLNLLAILCLLISWSLMGLWHGSNLSFLIWGIMHAIFLIVFRINQRIIPPKIFENAFMKFLSTGLTLYCVMLAWIPFRANDAQHTFELFNALFLVENLTSLGFREDTYLVTFIITICYFIYYPISQKFNVSGGFTEFMYILFKVTLIFIYLQARDQFIYFQF